MVLISGTTPTITFTFTEIEPSMIISAYLVIQCSGETVIEKDIESATVGETTLAWTLEQTDTLKLIGKYDAEVYCDWKTQDGTRGRSQVGKYQIEKSGKSCEI